MKRKFPGLALGILSVFWISGTGWALTIADSLVFPANTIARDERSGNGIDYTYAHQLTLPEKAVPLAGKLKLTHSDNSDEGPRQEIWMAFSGGGVLLGKLSKSEPALVSDTWLLPPSVLEELKNGGWRLALGLSEQTAFNSEQIKLFRSELSIDYEVPVPKIPASPEPASGSLILAGLTFAGAAGRFLPGRRKKNSA